MHEIIHTCGFGHKDITMLFIHLAIGFTLLAAQAGAISGSLSPQTSKVIRFGQLTFIFDEPRFKLSGRRAKRNRQGTLTIDGRTAWGTDGVLPVTKVSRIQITFQSHAIELPPVAYRDCFNASLSDESILGVDHIRPNVERIRLICGDGAAVYLVTFEVDFAKRSFRRWVRSADQ
ncbi:MAG: hypothetical protein ABL949_10435 [Fimbriimonadaceae bacterium]